VWVDGTLNGVDMRESLKTRDWTKAAQMVQKWEAEERVTKVGAPITLDQACTSNLADMATLSSETVRKYKQLEKQMKEFATARGLRLLSEFDVDTLTQFKATWKDQTRSANKKIERLRAFLRFAHDRDWVKTNPATKIKATKIDVADAQPLSPEELQAFYAACDTLAKDAPLNKQGSKQKALRLKPLCLVMRYGGSRISDAVKLDTAELQGNVLIIKKQTKTNKGVRVLLPDFVIQELAKCPMVTPTRYFWSGNGILKTATGDYQEMIKKAFDLAGIVKGDCNSMAHRFRDTFAVGLLLAETPIERVSKLLGHKNIAITIKHYSMWDLRQQKAADADIVASWENDPMQAQENGGQKRDKSEVPLPI